MKQLLPSLMLRFCVVAAVAAAVVSPASATGRDVPLRCGQMIEHSVVLHASLVCRTSPNGAALNVVGDGVMVDLNGYMISGGDTIAPLDGISITGADAVIKNGTVKDFRDGIATAPCVRGGATLLNMRVTSNRTGLYGVALIGSCGQTFGFTVQGSTISSNGQGIGVTLWGLELSGSTLANNGDAIDEVSTGCVCDHNTIVNNGRGIVAVDTFLQLTNSQVSFNRGDGIFLTQSSCVCDHDTILRNGGNGVEAEFSSLQFTNNWVGRNGLDGVITAFPSSQGSDIFASNTANENGGHGIVAASSSVDQGGNRAHGNALAPQCINIACSP